MAIYLWPPTWRPKVPATCTRQTRQSHEISSAHISFYCNSLPYWYEFGGGLNRYKSIKILICKWLSAFRQMHVTDRTNAVRGVVVVVVSEDYRQRRHHSQSVDGTKSIWNRRDMRNWRHMQLTCWMHLLLMAEKQCIVQVRSWSRIWFWRPSCLHSSPE